MKNRLLTTGALLAAVTLAACDDAATTPEVAVQELEDDVALLVADAVQEDLDVMNSVMPGVSGMAALADNVQEFTRSRTVTFYDAQGEEQEAYDPLTTDAINSVVELSGQRSRDRVAFTVERFRDLWVSGLEGEETERTWNGEGTEDRSRARIEDGSTVRSYTFSGSFVIEDVVRGVPRAENPWPLSGTITRSLTIEVTTEDGSRTVNREVVVTFNGTSTATMTVNGQVYDLDLASRARDRVQRRRGGS